MSKHTPGPWTYEPEEPGLAGAITAKTGWICDFDTDPSPENARLIAAAPDLLEALKLAESSLAHCFGAHKEQEGDRHRALATARAAIEKATGEAND